MHCILSDFEKHTGLDMAGAAALLGCAYVTYTQYRSGARDLPRYHRQHAEHLMRMPPRLLAEIVKEYVHGKA